MDFSVARAGFAAACLQSSTTDLRNKRYRQDKSPTRNILSCVLGLAVSLLIGATESRAQTTYFPAQGFYNGFLGQTNILECDNGNGIPVDIQMTMRRSGGQSVAVLPFSIPAFGSRHIILIDVVNIVETYGTLLLELGGLSPFLGDRVSCRTAFYRPAAANSGKQFDYAYALPIQNPLLGRVAGVYNSFDPSGGSNLSYNWLSITNFDGLPLQGTVDVYGINGQFSHSVPVGLNPQDRVDIALGHPQGQTSGLYVFNPADPTQIFDVTLIRYNTGAAGSFNFAFPLRAVSGSCTGEPLLASTMGNGKTDNWLEMANANSFDIAVTIEVRNRNGVLLLSERRLIPAFGQNHMFLSSIIDPARTGNVGSARVVCDDPSDRLIIQSSFYGHTTSGTPVTLARPTEWAYATQARGASLVTKGALLTVPVNTFVGISNWLKLADSSQAPSSADFSLYDDVGTVVAQGSQFIAGGGTADVDAHSLMGRNKVGSLVALTANDTASFSGEMLRVFSRTDGQIGTIVSVPGIVQQQGLSGVEGVSFRGDPQSLAPYRSKLTREEASHLLRRAAFGGNRTEVAAVVTDGLEATVDRLMTFVRNDDLDVAAAAWLDSDSNTPGIQFSQQNIERFWIHHMLMTNNPLKERLALMWHDIFALSCRVVVNQNEQFRCFEYVQTIRNNALGNYRTLIKELTVDYAMLIWLNNNLNRKQQPDENYAREHWELFTLGEKTKHPGRYPLYTETDIAEAARAFTGWTTQTIGGVPQRVYVLDNHDNFNKTFWKNTPYEVTGNFTWEDVTDLTLDRRPESAQFLVKRIFTMFAHDHPSPRVVNELAWQLRQANFDIRPVVKTILMSEALFSSEGRGARVKDGITYAVGFIRGMGLPYRADQLQGLHRDMGLQLTNPPDVSGWPLSKPGEAKTTDYYLAWAPQYANFITAVLRNARSTSGFTFANLLPSPTATSSETVRHLAELMGVRLSEADVASYVEYMDNIYNNNGTLTRQVFNPANNTHVTTRPAGVIWMLSQHDDYMRY